MVRQRELIVWGLLFVVGFVVLRFIGGEYAVRVLILSVLLLVLRVITAEVYKASAHVVNEYERLVVFRLGRCTGSKGPGLVWLIPVIERGVIVEIKEEFEQVRDQKCITRDNAFLQTDLLFYWRIVNAELSVVQVTDLKGALLGAATAALRAVIGEMLLDQTWARREQISLTLREKLREETKRWGVEITSVEIREIEPSQDVRDAMDERVAAEKYKSATITRAEADREAAILHADGTAAALRKIAEAAKTLDEKAMRLEYFETLKVLGSSVSTKYFFPVELTDLLKPFGEALVRHAPAEKARELGELADGVLVDMGGAGSIWATAGEHKREEGPPSRTVSRRDTHPDGTTGEDQGLEEGLNAANHRPSSALSS